MILSKTNGTIPFHLQQNSRLHYITVSHATRASAHNARGVMVIVAGYGHGDTSSNPRPD